MQSDNKDSLAKLIKDVEQAAAARICACEYFGRQESVDKCDGCRARGKRCYEEAFNDIASRLHALMPHDMDGREIKAGDTIKNANAMQMEVTDVVPLPVLTLDDGTSRVAAAVPHLWRVVEPDSWEKLREDAAKPVCEYAWAQKSIVDDDSYSCINCPYDEPGPNTDAWCNMRMRLDLVRRAKALAGVE